MKIIVLAKEVPDTNGERTLNLETGLLERDLSDRVLDEISERAVELALTLAETLDSTEVVVVSAGPESTPTSLRKALAMGADRAVHICDAELLGADIVLTADVLAAAARHTGFDLIICGNSSTDGAAGVVPAAIAELLQVPQLTALSSLTLDGSTVRATRLTESHSVEVSATLPAVASITESFPEARFPNFKGIMAAKKKPIDTLSLADLGIVADEPEAPRSIMTAVSPRPERESGLKLVDDGSAAAQLADFLVTNRLV